MAWMLRLALMLALAGLPGCSTFASLNSAAKNLDAYELDRCRRKVRPGPAVRWSSSPSPRSPAPSAPSGSS